ncbi:MAG: GNAT family N-acetyltransferase [Phycisphaeraceae bacterium]
MNDTADQHPSNNPRELPGLVIRYYRYDDHPHVERLYTEGLLVGQIPDNDTGADIENIFEAYFSTDRTKFWVAELNGKIVGMIGVAEDEPNIAEIRRLRVQPDLQATEIGDKLMETALYHCRHHGYLKVRLDTRLERGRATELFEKFAFQHHRTRDVPGKELLEFYMDLYRQPKKEEE